MGLAKHIKNFTLFLCLFFIATFNFIASAQVTIGSGETPERGAGLQLKEWTEQSPDGNNLTTLANSTKGLLFPKVLLKKYNELAPLYGENDSSTTQEKLKATGMVVYNVNPDAEGLDEGFYFWNGYEWAPFGSGSSIAEFEPISCDNIRIFGTYTKGEPLAPNANYISMEVNVTKKGSYVIVVTTDSNNGYYFSTSGTFLNTGKYTIILPGAGTPLNSGTDILKYIINNEPYTGMDACAKSITVEDKKPDYTFSCSTITVSTNLTVNTPSTTNDIIKMRITAPLSAAGATYVIETDEINGLSFSGEGIINGGTQIVTLYANGTPTISGNHTFTIRTNSTSSDATCTAEVTVVGRSMSVLILCWMSGTAGDRDLWGGTNDSNYASVRQMLTKGGLFNTTSSSLYPISAINVERLPTSAAGNSASSPQTEVQSRLRSATPPDIVLLNFDYRPNNETVATLIQYVNNGGVLIYCSDHDNETGASGVQRQSRMKDMIDGVFDLSSPGVTITPRNDYQNMMQLLPGNPIVEGMYQDISGKYLGRDSGWNCMIDKSTVPSDAYVLMRANDDHPRSIMHKTKPFVWIGDGGVFSGYPNSTSAVDYPCTADATTGLPVTTRTTAYWTQPGYNAHFFANFMAWAIEYVQLHRPDGGQIIP